MASGVLVRFTMCNETSVSLTVDDADDDGASSFKLSRVVFIVAVVGS